MKKKQGLYPSKVTLNLAIKEKSEFSPVKLLPLMCVLIVLAALFGKFAVADRLAAASEAEAELSAMRQKRDGLIAATEGYEELSEEYAHYSIGWMTEDEQAAVPRMEMLELIESELMGKSQVRRVSASGNILTVELGGVTLEDIAQFVNDLYGRPDVNNVAVYTASSKDESGNQGAVSMIITMNLPEEGGDGQ